MTSAIEAILFDTKHQVNINGTIYETMSDQGLEMINELNFEGMKKKHDIL